MGAALLIPALIGAGGSIAGGLLGGRRSKEEKAALLGQSELAKTQAGLMRRLYGHAEPAIPQIMDYFTTLLKGDRSKVAQLLGPFIDMTSEQFKSAETDISRALPVGGEANLALAGLRGRRAADLGRLFSGVQPFAVSGLSDILTTLLSQGGAGAARAGDIYAQILDYARQRGAGLAETGRSAGMAAIMGILLGGQSKSAATPPPLPSPPRPSPLIGLRSRGAGE